MSSDHITYALSAVAILLSVPTIIYSLSLVRSSRRQLKQTERININTDNMIREVEKRLRENR